MTRLALILAATAIGRVASGGPDALPREDRIRLAEAFRLAEAIGEDVWPGWSRVPFAVVLVTPESEFFIRHPRPPAGTRSLGRDDLLGSDVFVRPRTFPPAFLATFPIEGVSTVVVGQPAATQARTSTPWVVTLLHEHFHQLQDSQPGAFEKVEALGLSRGDTTGMWMLNFPFPYDSKGVGIRYAAAASALKASLAGADPAAWLGARQALRKALSDDDRKYLDFQVWKEGVARYTEIRVAAWAADHFTPGADFRALPDSSPFSGLAGTLRANVSRELSELGLASDRRVVFYAYGAGEALRLDRLRPCWREDYFRNPFSLETAFARKADCPKPTAAGGYGREEPPGHLRAGEPLLRVRPGQRPGTAHQELRAGRRGRGRLAASAPPRGLRRHPERRHLRGAARLSQQLGRGPSPDDAVRSRSSSLHRHRRLSRDSQAADADGRAPASVGAGRRVATGPRGGGGDPGGQRKSHGDLPGHVRGGQARASGVSPLVRLRIEAARIAPL